MVMGAFLFNAPATSFNASSSGSLSTLNWYMLFLSANRISALVLPTPEKTI